MLTPIIFIDLNGGVCLTRGLISLTGAFIELIKSLIDPTWRFYWLKWSFTSIEDLIVSPNDSLKSRYRFYRKTWVIWISCLKKLHVLTSIIFFYLTGNPCLTRGLIASNNGFIELIKSFIDSIVDLVFLDGGFIDSTGVLVQLDI